MENSPLNAVETTCRQCGAIADTGRIFCVNCGAALRATPLIPQSVENETQQRRDGTFISSRGVLLVFSLSALADFLWSLLGKRSVVESVISAVLGLFGTGWYLLIMWAASHNDSEDPIEPARWVP
jgi:hypothetical protein